MHCTIANARVSLQNPLGHCNLVSESWYSVEKKLTASAVHHLAAEPRPQYMPFLSQGGSHLLQMQCRRPKPGFVEIGLTALRGICFRGASFETETCADTGLCARTSHQFLTRESRRVGDR